MPSTKSSKKSVKHDLYLKTRNNSVKNKVRNLIRKFEDSLKTSDVAKVSHSFKAAQGALSMAVSKGVLHKKTCSRKTSRLNSRAKVALKNLVSEAVVTK